MGNGTALALPLKRSRTVLRPDPARVLLRRFEPGDARRMSGIIERIMAVPEASVGGLLKQVWSDFSERHLSLKQRFSDRFDEVEELLPAGATVSDQRRLLIGSYFLLEYSLESAALFSPSMVPHPDQTGLPSGALRFVLSLRATGEGHISSITFRSGIVHADNRIDVVTPTGFLTEPRQVPNLLYEKGLFERKLAEIGLTREFSRRVLNKLRGSFTLDELRGSLQAEQFRLPDGMSREDQL